MPCTSSAIPKRRTIADIANRFWRACLLAIPSRNFIRNKNNISNIEQKGTHSTVRSFFDALFRLVFLMGGAVGAAKYFRRPSVCFLHKRKKLPQTVRMKKIRIVDREGKLRDEKESCFPQHNGNKSIGAGAR